VRVVTDEFEIFELEVVNIFDGPIQFIRGKEPAIAGKLLARLFEKFLLSILFCSGARRLS
jgi:hypothetical protein